ncbi:MAG: hypothetical protein GNW80_02045 [Asgard group archaeon]|nr:hypothetical protein [Asgard group archaeon]
MGFIKKITEDYRKLKNWKKSLDDAVERNDSELLISMLNNPDFEDGHDDILLRLGNFADKEVIDIFYNSYESFRLREDIFTLIIPLI